MITRADHPRACSRWELTCQLLHPCEYYSLPPTQMSNSWIHHGRCLIRLNYPYSCQIPHYISNVESVIEIENSSHWASFGNLWQITVSFTHIPIYVLCGSQDQKLLVLLTYWHLGCWLITCWNIHGSVQLLKQHIQSSVDISTTNDIRSMLLKYTA